MTRIHLISSRYARIISIEDVSQMIRHRLLVCVSLSLLLMRAVSAQDLTMAPSDIEIARQIESALLTPAFKLPIGGAKPESIVEFWGGCGCISHDLNVFPF